jgi:hypothetical protein
VWPGLRWPQCTRLALCRGFRTAGTKRCACSGLLGRHQGRWHALSLLPARPPSGRPSCVLRRADTPRRPCHAHMQAKCPLYVHKAVWEENATPLKEIRGEPEEPPTDVLQPPEEGGEGAQRRRGPRNKSAGPGRGSRAWPPPGGVAGADEAAGASPAQLMTRIRCAPGVEGGGEAGGRVPGKAKRPTRRLRGSRCCAFERPAVPPFSGAQRADCQLV